MSDSDKANHWQELAEELGTEFKPGETIEETSNAEPRSPSRAPATAKPAKKASSPPKSRPASNWSEIGRQLGVEEQSEAVEPGSSPRYGEISDGSAEVGASDLSHSVAELNPTHELAGGTADGGDPAMPTGLPLGDSSGGDSPSSEQMSSPAQVETSDEQPRRRRRRRRRRASDDDSTAAEPGAEISSGPPSVEVDHAEGESQAEDSAITEAAEEESATPRRRRRRRRGRGKKSDESVDSDASVKAETGDRDLDEIGASTAWLGEDQSPDLTDSVEPEAPAGEPEESEADSAVVSEPSKRPREKKAAHRSIPTWQDAIGTVVEANIEARGTGSKTATASSNNRGGRRSRGGRRRKSSGS